MRRKTSQELAPVIHEPTEAGQYDIYPGYPIGEDKIQTGFETLATYLSDNRRVIIDGFAGVLWDDLQISLKDALQRQGITATWLDIRDAFLPEDQVEALVEPFLGGDDPVFGTRFTGELTDFFDGEKLNRLKSTPQDSDISIVFGSGATLVDWEDALLVYVDVPKNEIQFRSRAESVSNLGKSTPGHPKQMYKRYYFVDWVVLNRHKAELLPAIDLLIDAQRPDTIVFMTGENMRDALTDMSTNYFRVRPWFEPGAWGGQWMKQRIPQLAQDVPNYAWSFELITPENGLMFESSSLLLELSFDFLMYHDHHAVLGDSAERFAYEFPVRFDFLDTFDGGNLSLQCHPQTGFIKRQFGESFSQDETYYILDCEADAQVYLGFQEGISPADFRQALEQSASGNCPDRVDVERFVQLLPAKKHELFLIPAGTIHCSGKNNLILEISATPYIFTFKMYDWLRLDLDGKPRPLNIERAFENLRFDFQGEMVGEELVSKPVLLSESDGCRLIHLPTHQDHFYAIERYEIEAKHSVSVNTDNSFQVMSLVEGNSIILETANGMRHRFNYAETFVVPAGARYFQLVNDTQTTVKVINCFMKKKLN
jgi:mannose-6-phosphate isomerase class I